MVHHFSKIPKGLKKRGGGVSLRHTPLKLLFRKSRYSYLSSSNMSIAKCPQVYDIHLGQPTSRRDSILFLV